VVFLNSVSSSNEKFSGKLTFSPSNQNKQKPTKKSGTPPDNRASIVFQRILSTLNPLAGCYNSPTSDAVVPFPSSKEVDQLTTVKPKAVAFFNVENQGSTSAEADPHPTKASTVKPKTVVRNLEPSSQGSLVDLNIAKKNSSFSLLSFRTSPTPTNPAITPSPVPFDRIEGLRSEVEHLYINGAHDNEEILCEAFCTLAGEFEKVSKLFSAVPGDFPEKVEFETLERELSDIHKILNLKEDLIIPEARNAETLKNILRRVSFLKEDLSKHSLDERPNIQTLHDNLMLFLEQKEKEVTSLILGQINELDQQLKELENHPKTNQNMINKIRRDLIIYSEVNFCNDVQEKASQALGLLHPLYF